MKYKCIGDLIKNGKTILKEGNIVIVEGDKLYNITTGMDYKGLTFDDVVGNLVTINDEIPFESVTTIPVKTSTERFQEILSEMLDTYKKKNHDYGDSFADSLNEEGIVAARVRLSDKWNRFKQLSKGVKPKVSNESLRDTMLDMANYLIMTTIWLENECR